MEHAKPSICPLMYSALNTVIGYGGNVAGDSVEQAEAKESRQKGTVSGYDDTRSAPDDSVVLLFDADSAMLS